MTLAMVSRVSGKMVPLPAMTVEKKDVRMQTESGAVLPHNSATAEFHAMQHVTRPLWMLLISNALPILARRRLIERNQQVGTTSRKPFSPSFVAIASHLPLFSAIRVTFS
jgi:hypothetical protein